MQIENILEFIVHHRAPGLDFSAIGDLFDRLTWTLDDNGAEIDRVRRKWLETEKDIDKVRAALAMSDSFP